MEKGFNLSVNIFHFYVHSFDVRILRRDQNCITQGFESSNFVFSQMSPKDGLESDKKVRREIANSNERRRMQSINSGFQLLRTLIPHSEGEKLSKVNLLATN